MDQHSPLRNPDILPLISVRTESRLCEADKNEAEIVISRFYSTGVGVSIIVATMSAIIFASVPASSQSSSCGVSPSSDWDEGENPRDYLSIDIPGSGGGELFGFDGRSGLRALDKDVSTEWSDGSWEGFQESKWITVLRLL